MAGPSLLNAVGLHVDVLLHFAGQRDVVGGEQPTEIASERVELLQVHVGKGQHLGQESVDANIVGKLAAKALPLFCCQPFEPLDNGHKRCIELVLRCFAIEVDLGEGVDVCFGVNREPEQSALDLIEQIGIGRLGKKRRLVVGLEGHPDLIGFVGKVEYHRPPLVGGMDAVQARQRLHRVHAAELLVHVHRVQQRLVKAGLEFFGRDKEPVLRSLEGLGSLFLGDPIHAGLGVRLPPSWTVPEKATSALKGYPLSAK